MGYPGLYPLAKLELRYKENMSGETGAIAKMAEYVSTELFDWFKWNRVKLPDQNFECIKQDQHAPRKVAKHTHPVDAVFYYHDPYLNRNIYVNTDLKSYAAGSIDASKIVPALKSLACTIDCARLSTEWQERYIDNNDPWEVRGMLFVYNHDADYDKSFYDVLLAPIKKRVDKDPKPVNLENLPLTDGQSLHIFEPSLISYLTTLSVDTAQLHAKGEFPEKQYEFFYPEMKLVKTSGEKYSRPATLEMLAGPYLIIRHDKVLKYNESTGKTEDRYPEGYVIYYSRDGSTAEEFAYLLDILSGFQILDGGHKIRLRMINANLGKDPRSQFKRAINMYAQEWNFDKYRLNRLNEIEFEIVELVRFSFSKTDIGWERR